MVCIVDGCSEEATLLFTWAWGEEGACCNAHRTTLESKAEQLGRGISFAPLGSDDTPRKTYGAPTLTKLSPEVGALRMANAELHERVSAVERELAAAQERNQALLAELAKLEDQVHAPKTSEDRAVVKESTESAEPRREAPSQPAKPRR